MADSNGPTFAVLLGNTSVTLPPGAYPRNYTLSLQVEVTDPDGVDTVIGSYRLGSETVWHNMTLSYTPTTDHPDLYSAFVMNYTLGPDHSSVMWYFRFYANDSLGNWSSSGVWFRSAGMEFVDTTGPEFEVPWGNLSIDLIPNERNYALSLGALVTDPDGVDTVIGSYRLDTETAWHNITLTHTPRTGLPDLYTAFVMNYTFGGGDWQLTWYFKFYANDSLGNWALSGVSAQSMAGGALTSLLSTDLFANPYTLMAVASVAAAVFVIVLIMKYLRSPLRH
jgi:hypothetical protein